LDAVYKNIESKVLPSAMSAYSAAGRTPGGAGSYGGYAAEQLTNAYAPVAAQQFNNALSLAPQYAANDYADINALYGAGSNIQAQNQAQINEAVNRYQYNQNLPWDQLQKYLSLIQGSYGDTRTSPYYTNTGAAAASGALSGALGGAAMGSVVPGLGTGVGALMGGLLGGGGGLFSNSEFKEDITPVDGASALETVKNLPVSSWKYKPEFNPGDQGQHVGPMAEDLNAATGRGNPTTINLADEVGLLAAAFKELARRNDKRSRS
jgi:hypothetical protein